MTSVTRQPGPGASPMGGVSGGFTLVEILIAMTIAALALVNMHLFSKAGSTATQVGVMKSAVDAELDLTIDRISLALMGSSEDELTGPPRAPANSTSVEYAIVLGYEDGEPILSATESIGWTLGGDERGVVEWKKQSLDGGDEVTYDQSLVWSKAVPEAFLGESIDNERDDNGNGLLNERGLAFTRDGPSVEIHLTVERIGDGGEKIAHNKKHKITCRN